MKNVISQSLGLDLVNINVYPTVYPKNPLSLRDRAIFTTQKENIIKMKDILFPNILVQVS